jgi:hypothetical protein
MKPIIFSHEICPYKEPCPNPFSFKLDRNEKQVLKLPQSSRSNNIELDHHHIQKLRNKSKYRVVEHKWPAEQLRRTENTDERAGSYDSIPTKTNVKPDQQTIFGGHEVFSKSVHAEQANHGVLFLKNYM